MNRRSFLARLSTGLAAAVAGATIDPERLLWIPGQKAVFDLGARPTLVIDSPLEPFVQAITMDKMLADMARHRPEPGTEWTGYLAHDERYECLECEDGSPIEQLAVILTKAV